MTTAHEQLLAQRTRLLYALGNTSRVTEFEDRRTERFSPGELLEAIAGIDAEIAAASGRGESRVFTVASSSGLTGNGHCGGGGSYEAWR